MTRYFKNRMGAIWLVEDRILIRSPKCRDFGVIQCPTQTCSESSFIIMCNKMRILERDNAKLHVSRDSRFPNNIESIKIKYNHYD